jgi:hypothetical protein
MLVRAVREMSARLLVKGFETFGSAAVDFCRNGTVDIGRRSNVGVPKSLLDQLKGFAVLA